MQITWCSFGLVLLVCAVSLTFYVLFSLKSIEQMMITFGQASQNWNKILLFFFFLGRSDVKR